VSDDEVGGNQGAIRAERAPASGAIKWIVRQRAEQSNRIARAAVWTNGRAASLRRQPVRRSDAGRERMRKTPAFKSPIRAERAWRVR
jgi:hypothetical protein